MKNFRSARAYLREDYDVCSVRSSDDGRVLSFGPFVRAVAPEHFVAQIRSRLRRQLRFSEKTQNLSEK